MSNQYTSIVLQAFPRSAVAEDIRKPFPPQWGMKVNQKNQIYFMHHGTKQTSWQDPRFLGTGWLQTVTPSGDIIYEYRESDDGVIIYKTPVDPRALPEGWRMIVVANNHMMISDDNKHVFLETKSSLRTNVDPRGLPVGITQHIDKATHRLYFKDHNNRATQWEDPRLELTGTQRVALLREERTAWELMMIRASPDEQAHVQFAGEKRAGAHGGGAHSGAVSAGGAGGAGASAGAAALKTVASPIQPSMGGGSSAGDKAAVTAAIRMEGYTQFLCALFSGDSLSPEQVAALNDIRKERNITDAEHATVLTSIGKKIEDVTDMTDAGERLSESLNRMRQQQESCVCCMDAMADHVIMDCMHICLCATCAPLFEKDGAHCPQCRSEVKEVRKTFFVGN